MPDEISDVQLADRPMTPEPESPSYNADNSENDEVDAHLTHAAQLRKTSDNVYMSNRKSMNLRAYVHAVHRRTEAPTLLDSGATENFMSLMYAKWLKLPFKCLPYKQPLLNINGTTNKTGSLKYYIDLQVQTGTKRTSMCFFLTDLGHHRVILGYPWFASFISFSVPCTAYSPCHESIIVPQSCRQNLGPPPQTLSCVVAVERKCHRLKNDNTVPKLKGLTWYPPCQKPKPHHQSFNLDPLHTNYDSHHLGYNTLPINHDPLCLDHNLREYLQRFQSVLEGQWRRDGNTNKVWVLYIYNCHMVLTYLVVEHIQINAVLNGLASPSCIEPTSETFDGISTP